MAVTPLNENNFVKAVVGDGVCAVIEFYASWCAPCNKMMNVIEMLSEEFFDIPFYKVDADEEILLAAAFKATTLPTLVFAKDGIVLDVLEGNVPKCEIVECIKKIQKNN